MKTKMLIKDSERFNPHTMKTDKKEKCDCRIGFLRDDCLLVTRSNIRDTIYKIRSRFRSMSTSIDNSYRDVAEALEKLKKTDLTIISSLTEINKFCPNCGRKIEIKRLLKN